MSNREPETAEEFQAYLQARLKSDPEYAAQVEANERRVEEAAAQVELAEEPIVADLREAGVVVTDLWELDTKAQPSAVPVLLSHLERGGYPEVTTNLLGNELAVRSAVTYWPRIKNLYLAPRTAAEQEAAAIALSGCATAAEYDELVSLLTDPQGGPYRIFFLNPIVRLGRDAGWAVVESLRDDPELVEEISVMFKRRARRLRRPS